MYVKLRHTASEIGEYGIRRSQHLQDCKIQSARFRGFEIEGLRRRADILSLSWQILFGRLVALRISFVA